MNVVHDNFSNDQYFYMPLYLALVGYHNFQTVAASNEDPVWLYWISELKNHIENPEQLNELVNRIKNLELKQQMGSSHQPTLSDLIALIKNVKRNKMLDNELEQRKRLTHSHKKMTKEQLDHLIEKGQEQALQGAYSDFDKDELKRCGRGYIDNYINNKSGTRPKYNG